jgi:LmbE family N-acetylglucosaminyl deacetylase
MNELTRAPLTPKIVLGVAAHPDDLDFAAGGTMAAFAKQGAEVYYLILTDGGKGTKDRSATPESLRDLRRAEQRNAAKILGLKDVFFRDYPDGTLENTLDVKRDIVKVVRRVKPDVVVTPDPSVLYSARYDLINHPDHRAAGQAALDAVYPLARDHMSLPELLAEGYEPHDTDTVLLFSFDLDPQRANFAIDITHTLEQKLQALDAHASQFGDREAIKESLRDMAAKTGRPSGYVYAEPFVRIDIH